MLKQLLQDDLQKVVEEYAVKPTKYSEPVEVSETQKEHYPTVCLNSENFPEVKDIKVEESITVVLELKARSKSMYTQGKKENYSVDFEIHNIAYIEKKEKEEEEEKQTNLLKKIYGV